MTTQALLQVLASGLLMGAIYALIAAGLSLVFGLMDVVNFAHGEFLMLAMYLMFGLVTLTALDPVILAPVVVAVMFVFGAFVYLAVVRRAMRVRTNAGMVQIFVTFGLSVFLQGAAQFFFSPNYRTIGNSWLGGRTIDAWGVYLPLPQLVGSLVSVASFGVLYLIMKKTDLGKALEATREDPGAVALVGIDKNRVFMLGWGLGAALVGLAGSVLAIFYDIHPQVGSAFALIAYVVVALGGFGSVSGALAAGLVVGLVEALSAFVAPASMKEIGVYLLYLLVVFVRPRGIFGTL
jgi:branched-chain amino acid transport system permease protein